MTAPRRSETPPALTSGRARPSIDVPTWGVRQSQGASATARPPGNRASRSRMPYLSSPVLSLALCKTHDRIPRAPTPIPDLRARAHHGCSIRAACCAGCTWRASSLACAIFLAAVFVWNRAGTDHDTLLVAARLRLRRCRHGRLGQVQRDTTDGRSAPPSMYLAVASFDLLLVTAVVHVTGGGSSQFAALYILVIATAALLLPVGGGLLVAALGDALYMRRRRLAPPGRAVGSAVWLQLIVFVRRGTGQRLRRRAPAAGGRGTGGAGRAAGACRSQAADILRNIRSGHPHGRRGRQLLYANPAAEALLGIDALARASGAGARRSWRAASPELAGALGRSARERHAHHARRRRRSRDGTRRFADRRHDHDSATGRGGTRAQHRDGDLPGHLRQQAAGGAAPARRAAGGGGRAERVAGARDQEPARVDPQRRRAARAAHAAASTDEDEQHARTAACVRESDRLSRLLSRVPRLRARARDARSSAWTSRRVARGAAALARRASGSRARACA